MTAETDPPPRRGRGRQYFLAALVSGAAMAFLIWQGDWQALGARLQDARAWPAVGGLAAFGALLFVTALRLWRTLRPRDRASAGAARLLPLMRLTVRHAALLAFLPARLGDAYYPFMLRRAAGVSLGAAIGNLFVIRLYDLIAVTILFLTALVVLAPTGAHGAAAPAFAALGALVVLALALDRLLRAAGRMMAGRRRARALRVTGHLLRDAARWARALPLPSRFELLAYTTLRWLFGSLSLGLAFLALGLPLDLAEMLLLGSGLALSAAIPLQTMGGFGIAEGALAGLLVLLGQDWGEASATAIAARFMWLLFPAVYLIGYTAVDWTAGTARRKP